MPALDAYQATQLDDKNSMSSFLLAHRIRHQSYAYAASLQGISVGPYDFDDAPDDLWFNQHASSHQALQQFMPFDSTVDMTVLTNYSWDSQEDFATWMRMHTLIHQLLDQAFGIF